MRRAVRPGRPLVFEKATYARRNVVERRINRLKQWRGLATRYLTDRRGKCLAQMMLIFAWCTTPHCDTFVGGPCQEMLAGRTGETDEEWTKQAKERT